MSEVISFRLDKNNPREAQALEILDAWRSRGYSSRYVITDALLKLNDPGLESMQENPIPELCAILNQVNKLLKHLGNGEYVGDSEQDKTPSPSSLADDFVTSIRKVVC